MACNRPGSCNCSETEALHCGWSTQVCPVCKTHYDKGDRHAGAKPRSFVPGGMASDGRPAVLPPNPKQAYGDLKVPLAFVPSSAIIQLGLAFKEGARKYGPYNWREKSVETMTYAHAALRHIYAWIDGEDIDPESGMPHLALMMASAAIIIDAEANGCAIDNRPKKGRAGELLRAAAEPAPLTPASEKTK